MFKKINSIKCQLLRMKTEISSNLFSIFKCISKCIMISQVLTISGLFLMAPVIYAHQYVPFSFYNWETQTSTSNPTPNYQVIAENAAGLLFKNKRDRKVINVDPKV